MYVVGKDVLQRKVFVAQGGNHPALFCTHAALRAPHWIAGEPPQELQPVRKLAAAHSVLFTSWAIFRLHGNF